MVYRRSRNTGKRLRTRIYMIQNQKRKTTHHGKLVRQGRDLVNEDLWVEEAFRRKKPEVARADQLFKADY